MSYFFFTSSIVTLFFIPVTTFLSYHNLEHIITKSCTKISDSRVYSPIATFSFLVIYQIISSLMVFSDGPQLFSNVLQPLHLTSLFMECRVYEFPFIHSTYLSNFLVMCSWEKQLKTLVKFNIMSSQCPDPLPLKKGIWCCKM